MTTDQIYKAYCDQLVEIETLKEKLEKWEACADNLIGYAEIIQKTGKSQSTKHYSPISRDIEQYEKLKSETQTNGRTNGRY